MLSNFFEIQFKKEEFSYREKVFFTMIEEISQNNIIEKFYSNLIKNYIKKNVLIFDKECSLYSKENIPYKLGKVNYKKYLDYIMEINNVFKNHNESNFMTDLILHITKILNDGINSILNLNNLENKISNQTATNLILINQSVPINSHINLGLSKKKYINLNETRSISQLLFS